jgi:hypothetical protein
MLTEKQEQIIKTLKECFLEANKLTPTDFMGIKEFNENRKAFIEECRKSDDNFRRLLQRQLFTDQKIAQESLDPLGFKVTILSQSGEFWLVLSIAKREIYLKYRFWTTHHKEYGVDSISSIGITRGNYNATNISKALEMNYDDIKNAYVEANL